MIEEEWRPWNEWYDVSSLGRVRSWSVSGHPDLRRAYPKLIKPRTNGKGYLRFTAKDRKDVYVHRAVAKLFIEGETENKNEVAHNNGNNSDNRVNNLRWATRQENEDDKKLHGTIPRGEKHGATYITRVIANAIREEWDLGYGPQPMIAKRYNVSRSIVGRIARREAWVNVD